MDQFIQLIQSILVFILLLFNGNQTSSTDIPTPVPAGSTIQVYFLDVGQADAALVVCDGEAMLIDGGNAQDSSLIYSYLRDREIDCLKYIVSTHAHEDHVGGLSGALQYASVETVLSPVTEYDSAAFCSFRKYLAAQNVPITVPQAGDSYSLGNAEFKILSCNGNAENHNNASIVLRLTHGETSFLFMGDAERELEEFLLEGNFDLSSTVLKVGHHGSSSSTSYRFLWHVMPAYAVISAGAGNDYGHPHDAVLSRLRDADVTVYRTDIQGHILCIGDGKTLTFFNEK